MLVFPVQLTMSRIDNLTRSIHTLLCAMTIHSPQSYQEVNGKSFLSPRVLLFLLNFPTTKRGRAGAAWRTELGNILYKNKKIGTINTSTRYQNVETDTINRLCFPHVLLIGIISSLISLLDFIRFVVVVSSHY